MPSFPKRLTQFVSTLFLSAILALIVACATGTTAPTYGTVATPFPSPTHRPRQHSGDHIAGLGDPIDAPHFVDSFPNHSQTLTQVPARVGINFDIALTTNSFILVEQDGKNLTLGQIEFDKRKIYMAATLPQSNGDGLYLVKYSACFENEKCADGQIGFRVDAAGAKNFVDLTAQQEVTIHLKDVTYQPHQIIISRGTTVTWLNDDPFEHFVNSDPHPSHNAFPDFNSLDIPPSKTFSYTFDKVGEYAFHCSAHVPQNMFGTIIVREQGQVNIAPTSVAQVEPTRAPTYGTVATPLPSPTAALTAAPTRVPPTPIPPTIAPTAPPPPPSKVDAATLPPERFAAHFVSSSPEHAALLAGAPQKIQIEFNFTLARNSNIEIRKNGEKLALPDWELSENRLQMSVQLPDAGAGTYHVLFNACWPDKSCHPGEFAFVVQ